MQPSASRRRVRPFLSRSAAGFVLLVAVLFLAASGARAQTTVCSGQTGAAAVQCVQDGYTPSETLGYGPARDVMYRDIDSDAAGRLSGIYSGYTITLTPGEDPSQDAYSKDVNAEHVFPQSKGAGTEPRRSDIHNLYPARVQVNSARGNLPFGESPNAQTDIWYRDASTQSTVPGSEIDAYSERLGQSLWEPREGREGDVARSVFYFYTVYRDAADAAFFESMQAELLDWHQSDPVTAAERDRSQAIAVEQGNENPFVLDETLAGRIYGSGPAGPVVAFDPTTVTVSEDDGSATVTVRYDDPDGAAVDVDVALRPGESSAESGDVDGFTRETVSFPASATDGATRSVSVPIADDADAEGSETAVFELTDITTSGGAQIGLSDTVLLTIIDNENPLVINEVLADPAPNLDGDANGDGTRSATDDEFVEIYNTSASNAVDLSGYEYVDVTVGVRHVFPGGTTLAPGEAVVVFGGGTPAASIPGVVQTASTGTLALNNGGDTFRIVNSAGTEVLSFTFDGSVDDQSLTRDPDFTGGFVPHGTASGAGALFSPGKTIGGEPLPVELTAFDAAWNRRRGGAQLTWTTAAEADNADFAIERRVDRASEGSTWTQVGFEEGGGTTDRVRTYRFLDAGVPGGGNAFTYRLRQIDRDGTEALSDPVTVRRPAPEAVAVRGVFPNPARQQATLRMEVPERGEIAVEVYDVLGRQVWSTTARGGPGRVDVPLPAERLSSGVYGVRVRTRSTRRTARLTVAR